MGTEEAARRGDRSKQQVWALKGHPRPLYPRGSEPRSRQGLGREAAGWASVKAHPQHTAELQVCRANPVRGRHLTRCYFQSRRAPLREGRGGQEPHGRPKKGKPHRRKIKTSVQ